MKAFLFPCPACSGQMSSTAKACPHCGHVESKSRTAAIIFWITLVIVVGVLWVMESNGQRSREWRRESEQRAEDTRAILAGRPTPIPVRIAR